MNFYSVNSAFCQILFCQLCILSTFILSTLFWSTFILSTLFWSTFILSTLFWSTLCFVNSVLSTVILSNHEERKMDLSRGGIGGWRRRAPPSARLSLRGETVCVCFLILMFKVFLFLALFLNLMYISYKWAKKSFPKVQLLT